MDAVQILIAVIVTLWINWAHFMTWASSSSQEMMLAAQGLAGREHRYHLFRLHASDAIADALGSLKHMAICPTACMCMLHRSRPF